MSEEMNEPSDKLSFKRLKIPKIIPRELIELVKHRTYSPEEFYAYQEQQIDNPFNFLFALVDDQNKIHGYLWAEMSMFDSSLFVNTFSVDKAYWNKGEAIPMVVEFLRIFKKSIGAPRVFWITTNEKFFLKNGFKKSKHCLMEYEDSNQ